MSKFSQFNLFVTISTLLLAAGCASSKDQSSSTESDSELMAAATVGGSVGGTNVGFNFLEAIRRPTLFAKLESLFSPLNSAEAGAACPYYSNAGGNACSGNAVTFDYSNCSFGNSSAVWNGSQSLAFSAGATCNTTALPIKGAGAGTLTRTFAPGTTRTSSNGVLVNLDTQDASGYYQSVNGGFVISAVAGGHTIQIDGLHLTSSAWDHSISTLSNIQVTIDGSGNRTFTSGTLQIQHNLARYVAEGVLNNVYVPAGSCYPSSGSISTTFVAGSKTSGGEVLTFNGGNSATLVSSSGATTAVTLSHCF